MSFFSRDLGSGRHAAPHPTVTADTAGVDARREVWILQRHKKQKHALRNENTARLVEALSAHGIGARTASPDLIDQTGGPQQLRTRRRRVAAPAALIQRSGSNTGARARGLSTMLEAAGTVAFPTARALALAGDKLSAGRLLSAAGLPVPDFMEIGPGVDGEALGAALGWPLLLKAARGSKGRSVRLIEGPDDLAPAISKLIHTGPLIAQRFVAESRGRDVRVIVIGGKAIGAMAREASAPDAICANIASGGHGRHMALTPEIAGLAEAAARAAELEIAGVDLLYAGSHFAVCEINTAPGFVAFQAVTGIDVATRIAMHIAARLGDANGAISC
ncbi:MAG: RimK family alpha-L-glutamate ligase [Pseudomonadota bacterium]